MEKAVISGASMGDGIISASKGDIFGISEGANAFGFTTSFADVYSEQLSRVPIDKQTIALRQMGLVLVFKKALSRLDLSMMREHNISSFWTTVSIIPTHLSNFFP
jgi:hypothetical protein